MHTTIINEQKKGFIILNPVAGDGKPDEIQSILQAVLGAEHYDLYETTGEETLSEVVQTAVAEDKYGWVAAIGGDGTVSKVANGLVKTNIPLAIIPAGTGNALAQTLNIPQDTKAACQILLDSPTTRSIDGVRIGEDTFFFQMGIGLEALTMEKTSSDQKNRWGPVAYLWTAVKEAFGWQPYHFTLTVDGQAHDVHASELVIANSGEIGILGLEWEETIAPDDGRIDIAVIRARSFGDYARVLWALLTRQQRQSEHIRFFSAREEIRIDAETARRLPFHADGEMVENDELPLTAVVVPAALRVIVPPSNPD